jgi:hypothetical protein
MSRYLNLRDRFGLDFPENLTLGRLPESELRLPQSDVLRLRALGTRKRAYAEDPVMDERRARWRAANDLCMTKPPIFVDEICWAEIDDPALKPECAHPFARELEDLLLKELYCLDHDLYDQVAEPFVENPLVVYDSGFGIDEVVDTRSTGFNSEIVSRHFHVLIEGMDDIEKIREPEVVLDMERTKQYGELLSSIFDGILPVVTVGARGLWFTPWDYLIRVMGVDQTFVNLYDEPEFVEAVVRRYVDMAMRRMEKYRKLGVWASNNAPVRVGSGGCGLVSRLDAQELHPYDCPTSQMWGCGNAQIFSSVSPAMHWQFSLQYEMDWLKQFGLTYYGCCEPLSGKMDLMDKIPNLRKVSMSPWNNFEAAAERCRGKYVMSCKPSPAVFAGDSFDEGEARRAILAILNATKGCSIELVMKDISTLRFKPERLHAWAKVARDTVNEYFA